VIVPALLAALLAAPAGAARVLAVSGKANVAKGASLKPGAVVETGEGGLVLLELEDGSRAKLRASSSVEIRSEKADLTELMLKLGGVFARAKKRLKGEFRVRTPSAVVAVRGTEFFTAYGRKKRKGDDLWVCVNTGAVEVGVLLKNGKDLTKPQAYDWTKQLNWNMEPEKGELEDRTSLEGAYSDPLDRDYK
jgi:hypothetical protein